MKYKIVADSSTDVTKDMQTRMNMTIAPLTLEVDGIRYVDDDDLDVDNYLAKANSSAQVPKSSCPSPDDYLSAYRCEEDAVFVITLSSELSGSYASAILAKDLLLEENPDKKIHVFNSRSACAAQVAIALKLEESIKKDMTYEEIISTVEAYIAQMATVFVLEKIDHLQKAGRMSKTKATIANVLNIKLILIANKQGEINLVSQARGTNRAIDKMIQSFGDVGTVSKDKFVVVAYCQDEQRGQDVKLKIETLYDFKEVILVKTRGLSSNYANSGGIVIAF